MFLTDGQITQSVLDLLKQTTLPAYLGSVASPGNVVVEAHAAAYNEIVGRLLNRGYTKVQVDAWDQGAFYERMISLWFVMVNDAGTFAYDPKWLSTYDRRRDLDTVLLSIGGAFVAPGTSDGPGTVGFGQADSRNDLIVLDPDDNAIGQVTKW